MNLKQLTEDATGFDFYHAVYSLERQFSAEQKRWQGIGRDGFPKKELIRFKSVQHLGFPGQPISKVEKRQADAPETEPCAVAMHVSFMGLTGPSGVMPQHYTEMVLQRLKQRDKTMRDFFDLFNHRLISLYYRAWEKYRFACQYEMSAFEQDSFSSVLKTISGANSSIGLYYAGAFSQYNRSSQQLIQILTELLNTKVALNPLQGRWLTLASDEQSRLAMKFLPKGQNAGLGQSAMLGSKVWDVSSAIELEITAPPEKAQQLLPGSYQHRQITALLAEYLPAALKVRITLVGQHQDFPVARLSSSQLSLGHSGSLAVRTSKQHQMTRLSYQLGRS
ncbi:type VI secretion system baseplate subunit TssG [Rheinheimera baltica]|uniref:type VI secretion system baseplate subunit TssG n=1 Tax=Rheinheimera baltica TaxID=67576 RepID=UPI00273D8D70|nr:type VI secretion system baseplate subunit TssG [Rheinheimera baltica]MDP5143326.1 type VI secretion system baseplate subunit TssG [Rheinheimera baltica]